MFCVYDGGRDEGTEGGREEETNVSSFSNEFRRDFSNQKQSDVRVVQRNYLEANESKAEENLIDEWDLRVEVVLQESRTRRGATTSEGAHACLPSC